MTPWQKTEAEKAMQMQEKALSHRHSKALKAIKESQAETQAHRSAKILENSGIIVTDEYILNYVDEAEKVGLISRKLININDEPFSSWAV